MRKLIVEGKPGWVCFLYADTLKSGTLLILDGLPFSGLPVPRDTKQPAPEHTFQIQTNWSRTPTPAFTFWTTVPCSDHPGQVPDNQGYPVPQRPLEWFKVVNPKPAFPALPVPSRGSHCKAFVHGGSLSLCQWCGIPLPLGTMSNKLTFQWHSFPDLLALPYLTFSMNIIYFKTIVMVNIDNSFRAFWYKE